MGANNRQFSSTGSAADPQTFAYTVGAGAKLLLVKIAWRQSAELVAVRWGATGSGSSGQLLSASSNTYNAGGNKRTRVYHLINPTARAPGEIWIDMPAAGNVLAVEAVWYDDIDTTNPIADEDGNGTGGVSSLQTANALVPSGTDNYLETVLQTDVAAVSVTPQGSATESQDVSVSPSRIGMSWQTGISSNVQPGWDLDSGTAQMAMAAVLLKPSAGAVIADVDTDEIVDDLQQNVAITGTGFGATQGAGKVEVGDNSTYASATKVELPVDSWSDTSIQVDFQNITGGTAISLVLRTRPLYVFVTPDGGSPSAAFGITLNDSDPYLEALDKQLSVMQGLTPGTQPAALKAHWHFDDPSGAVLEDRWRGHDGTLVGSPTLAQAALPPSSGRSSIRFAAGQRADVAHHADFAQAEGGFFMWWRANALSDGSYIWNKSASTPGNHDVEHYFDADGSITFRVHDGTQWRSVSTAPGYVIADQDVHSGVIWDNTGWTFYVDGNAVGSKITQHTAGLVSNSRAWRFGAAPA